MYIPFWIKFLMNHEVMRGTELKEVPGKNNTVLTDYKCVDI